MTSTNPSDTDRTALPIHHPSGYALRLKVHLIPLHDSSSSMNTGKEGDNWTTSGAVALNPDAES